MTEKNWIEDDFWWVPFCLDAAEVEEKKEDGKLWDPSLEEIVIENSPNVVENFEKKFKEIRVEGKRKSLSSSTMYTETLPATYYTVAK